MSLTAPVDHVRPDTLDEAVGLLASEPNARVLAGGYSLMPLLKDGELDADLLIDISRLDVLHGITRENDMIRIGALTTHDSVMNSEIVTANATALSDAAGAVGDFQAKHNGTIGGNLVVADPKYDPPPAFLALGGTVRVTDPSGKRRIQAEDWFRDRFETALEADEIVTDILVPETRVSTYSRMSSYLGYPVVGVAVALDTRDGIVDSIRIAVNGAFPCPTRLTGVEQTLQNERLTDERIDAASDSALTDVDPANLLDNEYAAGRHRLRLLRAYCNRALKNARALAVGN